MAPKKSKILLVDDDPMNILILEEIIGEEYTILKATTAEEAATIAEEYNPDLILIDLMLQDASGYEVCKKLRENQKLTFTKIILVSSKSLLKDRLTGYQAGADDYLSKPFDPEELLAKVKVFIRLKSVEEIDRVKDDVINIFSHETRTPLNAIIGFAKLLKSSPSLSDDEREFAALILESGMSLLSLSNKAILLARLRKADAELSLSDVSLKLLVETAIKKLPAAFTRDLNLIKTEGVTDSIVLLDEKLVQQALSFILENAIKFSPNTSSVTITSNIDESSNLCVSVKDQGGGIPPGRVDTLFDEFGIQDVSHHGRGHGLSLAIVRYVMELHEGKVDVVNNSNKGATFSLIFPPSCTSYKTN